MHLFISVESEDEESCSFSVAMICHNLFGGFVFNAETAIFFQGFFFVSIASSFRQVLQIYSEICIFCSMIQYIVSKKYLVRSAHKVLVESLETVLDGEAHFIVCIISSNT